MQKYRCPCCGFYTYPQRPTNTFQICPVCYWEDDGVQFLEPDYAGGANTVSLHQAQHSFHTIGASEPVWLPAVRPPRADELQGIDWEINCIFERSHR